VSRLTDPRDVYELAANYGARRLRACILGVVPGDVQDLAIAECDRTLKGHNAEPLIDRIRKMVGEFGRIGVPQEAIERRLQHKAEACNEQDVIALGKIYLSMRDGMSTREDWFELHASTAGLDERAEKQAKDKPKQEPAFTDAAGTTEPLAESQVDPKVEETEGVDEPAPTDAQIREHQFEELIAMAEHSSNIAELRTNLESADLPAAAKKRVLKKIEKRGAELTAK